jgi:hypothetical protein
VCRARFPTLGKVIGRLDLICPQKKKENENENRFDFQTTARPSVRSLL